MAYHRNKSRKKIYFIIIMIIIFIWGIYAYKGVAVKQRVIEKDISLSN